jgi:hypothetical protein
MISRHQAVGITNEGVKVVNEVGPMAHYELGISLTKPTRKPTQIPQPTHTSHLKGIMGIENKPFFIE